MLQPFIIPLPNKDIIHLIKTKTLKAGLLDFEPDREYLFFNRNKVYGSYLLKKRENSSFSFTQSYFEPLFYYLPTPPPSYISLKKDGNKILRILSLERRKSKELSLEIRAESESIFINWHSLHHRNLFGCYRVKITEDFLMVVKELNHIYPGSSNRKVVLNRLVRNGKLLYNRLFKKELKDALRSVNTIYLKNDSQIPLGKIHDGVSFIGLSHQITLWGKIEQSTSSRFKTIGIVLSGDRQDEPMKNEFEKIEKNFLAGSDFKINTLLRESPHGISKNDFMYLLETSGLVHFIGHGESNGRMTGPCLYRDKVFTVMDFEGLTRVPRLWVLSCCCCLSQKYIQLYFEKGGETLVYNRDRVVSKRMDELFASFYWQLLNKKTTVGKALMSIKRKSFRSDLNWSSLELAGNHNLRLVEN